MSDRAPLDPEQVAEIRNLTEADLSDVPDYAQRMAAEKTAVQIIEQVPALCATVEHLRERLERAEEALRQIQKFGQKNLGYACHPEGCPGPEIARDALNRMEAEDE